jgi:hypothetical protein
MFGSNPNVAAECLPRAIAEWSCTLAPALAQDESNILLEVQMAEFDSDQLGNP